MEGKDLTPCCGVYCPDCIWYRNDFSALAKKLKDRLKQIDFDRYASVKSPFSPQLEYYQEILTVLNFIAENDCSEPCRKGGGCAGRPCKIMKCAAEKQLEGCWQCEEMKDCEKFDILTPRCGDTPYKNLMKIRELGYKGWIKERDPYYIWQRKKD